MIEGLAFIVAYLGFGAIGFAVSQKIKKQANLTALVILIPATVFSQWFLPHAILLGLGAFTLYVRWAVQAFFGGVLLGVTIHLIRHKTLPAAQQSVR